MKGRNIILASFFLFAVAACDSDDPGPVPDIRLSASQFTEQDNNNSTDQIPLRLTSSYGTILEIGYSFTDGSALAGNDYVVAEGTISIPSGETEGSIPIEIVADEHIELTENLMVNLTSSVGINESFQIYILDTDLDYEIESDSEGFTTPIEYPSMKLAWSDEFEGEQLKEAHWNYDIGDGCDQGICGWGNEELESYSDSEENIFLEDGKLHFKAVEIADGNYTSGKIHSKEKASFKFGRIDIRAKLPKGQGIWPALWMLGTNIDQVGWPACGEIDIMEMIGQHPGTVHGTVHYDANGYAKSGSLRSLENEEFADKFHVFSILWDQGVIRWYVDYDLYYTVSADMLGNSYPFNSDYYFIMNVAVGGLWPGDPDETTQFPQEMVVDYVRVFQ